MRLRNWVCNSHFSTSGLATFQVLKSCTRWTAQVTCRLISKLPWLPQECPPVFLEPDPQLWLPSWPIAPSQIPVSRASPAPALDIIRISAFAPGLSPLKVLVPQGLPRRPSLHRVWFCDWHPWAPRMSPALLSQPLYPGLLPSRSASEPGWKGCSLKLSGKLGQGSSLRSWALEPAGDQFLPNLWLWVGCASYVYGQFWSWLAQELGWAGGLPCPGSELSTSVLAERRQSQDEAGQGPPVVRPGARGVEWGPGQPGSSVRPSPEGGGGQVCLVSQPWAPLPSRWLPAHTIARSGHCLWLWLALLPRDSAQGPLGTEGIGCERSLCKSVLRKEPGSRRAGLAQEEKEPVRRAWTTGLWVWESDKESLSKWCGLTVHFKPVCRQRSLKVWSPREEPSDGCLGRGPLPIIKIPCSREGKPRFLLGKLSHIVGDDNDFFCFW